MSLKDPKEPLNINLKKSGGFQYFLEGKCPSCKYEYLFELDNYCRKCGQKLAWTAEQPEYKYYLLLPHEYRQTLFSERGYLNYVIGEDRYFFSENEEGTTYQTQFTQEEIDNLPNQDFIKTLEKVEVK